MKSKKISRRGFFRNSGLGAAAIAGMPLLAGSCRNYGDAGHSIRKYFSRGDVILFQGDSITDAGRNKERQFPNQAGSFGGGYAFLIASWLLEEMPQMELTIYNRGISGNKVYQLAERWDEDGLELEPGVLSILIGVNDYWHMRNGKYDGTPGIYEADFRALMQRTVRQLPGIRLVICQPFILPGTSAVDETWLEPFSDYQQIARNIAGEFDATWVPFQEAFNEALEYAPAPYWAADGVHPTMAGAQLMADTWLNALQG
jgi:lysophospholipase L1-like esterase